MNTVAAWLHLEILFCMSKEVRKPIDVSLKMFSIVNKKAETLAQICMINLNYWSDFPPISILNILKECVSPFTGPLNPIRELRKLQKLYCKIYLRIQRVMTSSSHVSHKQGILSGKIFSNTAFP